MLDWVPMPEASYDLLAVYVDGETKTGKGAAGKAITALLSEKGLAVYYDVAGDFFRRYVAIVRNELGLGETDPLPTGEALETAAKRVYDTKRPFAPDDSLGDLQRSIISQSVSVLGELSLVQRAGAEWYAMSIGNARQAGADVVVLDGRNPRDRVNDVAGEAGLVLQTALDLFMTCEPEEAARRVLYLKGVTDPSHEQIVTMTQQVKRRREHDRNRLERPFLVPSISVHYDPKRMAAPAAVNLSWHHATNDPPTTIAIDNTHFTQPEMLAAVRDLAAAAVDYINER